MNIRRFIISSGLLIIGAFIFFWFFNHGYLEVEANVKTAGYRLVITDQKTGKKTELTPESNTTKKFVSRGSYEVFVSEPEQNYVAIAEVSGFMKTVHITTKATAEHARKFIGDNPGPCMFYTGSVLFSYGCSDTFNNFLLHKPATQNDPSYTQKNSGSLKGMIEGVLHTKQGNLVLLKVPGVDEDQGAPHTIYGLDESTGDVTTGTGLSTLNDDATYDILGYKQGFVIFSSAELLYFESPKASPKQLALPKPKTKNASFVGLATDRDKITALYATNTEEGDAKDQIKAKGKSEVIVLEDSKDAVHYTFKQDATSAALCGDKLLCLMNSTGLSVYDITDNKPAFLYQIFGAKWVKEINKRLYIVNNDGVLVFDTNTKSGSLSYSFGSYEYCGIQSYDKGYVLCLITPSQDKVALVVDVTQSNKTSIDKKIAKLLDTPEIKKISIYDSFIYITPDAGDLIYDDAQQTFTYDPVKKASANAAIQKAVDAQKIDRNLYRIINTIP